MSSIMKCAIYVLAFCAFETIFAEEFLVELNKLRDESNSQLKDILAELGMIVRKKIQEVRARSERVTDCWKEYGAMKQVYQNRLTKCDECYRKALQHKNIEIAKKSYAFNIAVLENEKCLRRSSVHHCIRKIVEEAQAAAAREEIKHQVQL